MSEKSKDPKSVMDLDDTEFHAHIVEACQEIIESSMVTADRAVEILKTLKRDRKTKNVVVARKKKCKTPAPTDPEDDTVDGDGPV